MAVRNAMRITAGDDELTGLPRISFIVLETERGFLFGLVTCAPAASPALPSVWSNKPHNYCAGLPLPLATLAVNLATALEPTNKTVVDPCCGSGTLLFAAACLGAGAVAGVERHQLLLHQAAENLSHTAGVAEASRNQLAQESGVAQGSSLTPQLLCADSNLVLFETRDGDGHTPVAACMRVYADAREKLAETGGGRRRIDAFVSNLPYGRMVGVGDQGLEALAPLLSGLRLQASRHAFFSGTRLAPLLRSLGYADVDEVCVDARGRRFLALASCGD